MRSIEWNRDIDSSSSHTHKGKRWPKNKDKIKNYPFLISAAEKYSELYQEKKKEIGGGKNAERITAILPITTKIK